MKAAFFDFDGTLYNGVIAFDFLKYLIKNKFLASDGISKLPSFLFHYIMDKLNLKNRYDTNKALYSKLKGWNAKLIEEISSEFCQTSVKKNLYRDIVKMLKQHKKDGYKIIIVTSALREIIIPVKKILPVDDILATEIKIVNDIYSGKIKSLPVGHNRINVVRDYCKKNQIELSKSYAYSDHFSDVAMLKNAGRAVATRPEKKLLSHAKSMGWKIIS